MAEDFNTTAVLEDIIINSIDSAEEISGDFATESSAIGTMLFFFFIILLLVIVIVFFVYGIKWAIKGQQ